MDVGVLQGRKIIVTRGGGYFGHKLRNKLKKMGAVIVLFDLSRPLDEVVKQFFLFPTKFIRISRRIKQGEHRQ